MPELRWILLLAGLVVVVLLYLFGRRGGAKQRRAGTSTSRIEPQVGEAPAAPAARPVPVVRADPGVADESPSGAGTPDPEPAGQAAEKVIVLHVASRGANKFSGADLIAALRAESLRYGRLGIFHRYMQQEGSLVDPNPVFGVANMHEPGTFDLDRTPDEQYQGVSMFLALPGPSDPLVAFADMLATGRRLAATLGGELLDQTGSTVSRQSASHIREEIINYQHGIKVDDAEPRA